MTAVTAAAPASNEQEVATLARAVVGGTNTIVSAAAPESQTRRLRIRRHPTSARGARQHYARHTGATSTVGRYRSYDGRDGAGPARSPRRPDHEVPGRPDL